MSSTSTAPSAEGTAAFPYKGETYQTWYKVFGDLQNRTRPPLICLHGGPGLVHDYLLPLADLAASASVPIVLYDQIGGGHSTLLPQKSGSFWSIDLFIDELENLLGHLGVTDAFYLLGHSWGGILASEYAVRRQPKGLKGLILTNSLASYALWVQSNIQLLQGLPSWVMEGVAAGYGNKEKLLPALKELHAKHGCLLRPQPEEFTRTLEGVFADDARTVVPASMYVVSSCASLALLTSSPGLRRTANLRPGLSSTGCTWLPCLPSSSTGGRTSRKTSSSDRFSRKYRR